MFFFNEYINSLSKSSDASLLNENGYLGINYVIPNQDMYNKLMDVLTHNFDYVKEYGVVGNDQFKYILVSDKEIKSEDVI